MVDVDFAHAVTASRDQARQMSMHAAGQGQACDGFVPSGPEQAIGVANRLSVQQPSRELSEPPPRAARRGKAAASEYGIGPSQAPNELFDFGGRKLPAGFEHDGDFASGRGDALAERHAQSGGSIDEQQPQARVVVE
jgi:hypothetical protein